MNFEVYSLDSTARALQSAAALSCSACAACRTWEEGGDPDPVTHASAIALTARQTALEAVIADEPWDQDLAEPEGRRARLAYAGWLTLLAATDEHGESVDFEDAARLLDRAARA